MSTSELRPVDDGAPIAGVGADTTGRFYWELEVPRLGFLYSYDRAVFTAWLRDAAAAVEELDAPTPDLAPWEQPCPQ